MKGRSKAGGEAIKGRRRKTPEPKRRDAPKVVLPRSNSPATRDETKVAGLTRKLREALEQQTATSEVLRVISRSPGDLQPVFQAMLKNAVRLCEAKFGNIYRWDGDALHLVATQNAPAALAQARSRSPFRPSPQGPQTPTGRMIANKTVVHTANLAAEEAYTNRDPWIVAGVELGGVRTVLMVPMLKDDELIGAFSVYRQKVRPFADNQIALVQNFAAQAVIAVENARLLNELRQRTNDLTEALEQQTATSEVLQVISSSPGNLEPVFASMVENAVRICHAQWGNIHIWDGDTLHLVATHNVPAAFAAFRRSNPHYRPHPRGLFGRLVATQTVTQIADSAAVDAYTERLDQVHVAAVELGGARTALGIPMLKENQLIGAFALIRREVRPFTEKQIALLENFAAQAVIAIENARLLSELRQSLERQTATSEVLKVISQATEDPQQVFESVLENAIHLCEAKFGNLYLKTDDGFRYVATHGVPSSYLEAAKREPRDALSKHELTPLVRMARIKKLIHVADLTQDPSYLERDWRIVALVEGAEARTIVVVPMLKDEEVIGAVAIYRQEVRPFFDQQIELVQNFAAQAVIAIENARLLRELRERTGEVEKLNQQLEQRVADQVGEIERMGRLRRFLPPQVADLIVASGSEKQLESHRREITALFCDLRGFTGFTESADAEDVMALLRDYHAAIGELIIKYSGTLERYAGDGVMVVFNDPVPVEKPALQAVLMALETRDAIGALTEKWGRLGHDIGFGIGIAHGFATLGTIGFEGRFDYAAIGTVSNVASRLCDEAKPGQILISPRVLMAVEDAVTFELVGEFALKGIRRPLAAYNVLAQAG
jgi:GAF domain-containing protein